MALDASRQRELRDLIDAWCEDAVSAEGVVRLESILMADDDACRCYLDYLALHGLLSLMHESSAVESVRRETPLLDRAFGADESAAIPSIVCVPPGPSPAAFSLGSPLGRYVLSYGVAALAMTVLLMIGLVWKISYHRQAVQEPIAARNGLASVTPVARVTGSAECEWTDPRAALAVGAQIAEGQAISLASGLLEVTYDSGARVILEGPCAYEVESPRGGFLSLGKLTARIVASGQWPVARKEGTGSRDQGSGFDISRRPSLATDHQPLATFTVRTPTAIVTDLGTEFGVEVSKDHRNSVRVYQGRVAVASAKIEPREHGGRILRAGECASLDAVGTLVGIGMVEPRDKAAPRRVVATEFVRRLPKPIQADGQIDLLDILAGGNGLERRRESGIDPTTGGKTTMWDERFRMGCRKYLRTAWNPLVDGVFVPNSSVGPVQLDSAGHRFAGFTASVGRCYGSIWPQRKSTAGVPSQVPSRYQKAVNGQPLGKPLALHMHADTGITFDLAAIRAARPDVARLVGFRSSAQAIHPDGVVDFWIFVDGQLRWNRRWCTHWIGPSPAHVSLGPNDRFLTLVATDCNDDISGDYTIFVAPVLEAVMKEQKKH